MDAASNLLNNFVTFIINPAILLVFAVGFAGFMYGLFEFMWKLNSGEASSEGKRHMIYGILGMLIMVSVYGIIKIIDDTFGFGALQQSGGAGADATRLNNLPSQSYFNSQ